MAESLSLPESGAKFHVAICGCGIAGLILAITIGKHDPSLPIDIYEAHESVETAGVGIALRRHEVLMELGLLDEFRQILIESNKDGEGHRMRRSDIRDGGYVWWQRTSQQTVSFMHRQHMVAILERHLPGSCKVHFGKRLVNYVEPEQDAYPESSIRLEFADGTSATTNVLVGADGIRSAVRKTLFETASKHASIDFKQYAEAAFTGIEIYRYLVSTDMLSTESPKNFSLSLSGSAGYHGKGKFLVTYPIAKGAMINCVAVTCNPDLKNTRYEGHWVSDASRDELVELFDDFEPDARAIIKLCNRPSKWALHVVKPLPFCVRSKVALIGDACHAAAPFLAAGAGQGIEDAFVLGRLIAHPLTSLSRIHDVLRIYEEVRLPVAREVANISSSSGWLVSFMEPGWYDGARKEDSIDEMGISAYEKEGMESIKKETERHYEWLEGLAGSIQSWHEAELKLQALVN